MSRSKDPFEPWFHEASGFWCKKLKRKLHYLARDYKTAKKRLRIMVEAKDDPSPFASDWLLALFSALAAEYMNDVQARRAPGTYRNYRDLLVRAMKIIGPDLKVGEIRRLHLRKIERAMTGKFSPVTVRDTLSAVQQVFNWAVEMELLESTPIAKYAKPSGKSRSRVITEAEFQALLRHSDPPFRRLLIALRLTGCRPGEARCLRWDMVDLEHGLWIIPKHKTVTMQQEPLPRVIPLPLVVLKLCQWLARKPHDGDGHVFCNLADTPYTKDCCVRKMARIRVSGQSFWRC